MNHFSLLNPDEEEQLRAFRMFYANLPDRRDIFYMFFTSGLLHWVARSSQLVPRDVNLVLLGANLSANELVWLREQLDRPFHHISMPVDDKLVWEILFCTNEHHFGWIDIDCFVLNPDLFGDMKRIELNALANCTWTFFAHNVEILLTYFLFLNIDVLRDVTSWVPVSPCTYSYELTRDSRSMPGAFCRLLTPKLVDLLGKSLPVDDAGHPLFLSRDRFFDTLQVYQMAAQALGYRLNPIRRLPTQYSEELIHVGKVSYYEDAWGDADLPQNRKIFGFVMQADYLLLRDICHQLPQYALRRKRIERELQRMGIAPQQIGDNLRQLLASRGIGPKALQQILGDMP